jgi:lysophospholipase
MDNEQTFRRKYETRVLPFYRKGHFGEFAGIGGLKIRYLCLEKKNTSGALVVLPGKSDTYLKYAELFYDLQELNMSLYSMDHRGMGFSQRMLPDRLKMHVKRFDDYVEDVRTFLDTVVKAGGHEHLFVLGHSTGGLIAALYLENYPEDFRAVVLCSPLFELNAGPTPGFVLRAITRLLDRPGRHEQYSLGQKNLERLPFEKNTISHSYPRWSLWEQEIIPKTEAIQFGGVTNRWIRESLLAGHRAVEGAEQINVPVLLLQAEQDSFTKARAQNRFCRRAPLCRKVLMQGAKHEILIEREDIRDAAIAHIKAFLNEQLRNGR